MRRSPILFLQAVIVCIGAGVLALMLWEPQLEGRNVDATQAEIYFHDPFLAYAYAGSVAFFVALYQACRLLGRIGRDEAFTPGSVRALRRIRYCALVLIVFILGAEAYLVLAVRGEDDIAGGVALGGTMVLVSATAAALAAVAEGILQRGVDLKAESDPAT